MTTSILSLAGQAYAYTKISAGYTAAGPRGLTPLRFPYEILIYRFNYTYSH